MLGVLHTVTCHREDANILLDSWARTVFNYDGSVAPSSAAKADLPNGVNDAYFVKLTYAEGTEPTDDETRLLILSNACAVINAVMNDEVGGLVLVA